MANSLNNLLRKLKPELSSASIYVEAVKDGRNVRIYSLKEQRNFQGCGPGKTKDKFYRTDRKIPYPQGRKRLMANGWKPAQEIHPDASLMGEWGTIEELIDAVFFRLEQGEAGDCWLDLAIILLRRKPELLRWMLSKNNPNSNHWTLLLKVNGFWTAVHGDKMVAMLNDDVAFMNNVGAAFTGSAIEKLVSKLFEGRFVELDKGGTFLEALYILADGYGLLFDPSKLGAEELTKHLFDYLAKDMLVSLGTKARRSQDYPYVENDHVIAPIKLVFGTLAGKPAVFVLVLDPHGTLIRAPFRPGTPSWNRMDPESQAELAEDLARESGLMVVPIEVLVATCNLGEAFCTELPPDPVATEDEFDWHQKWHLYRRVHGSWDNTPTPQSLQLKTQPRPSRCVVMLDQIGRRFDPKKKYLHLILEAYNADSMELMTPAIGEKMPHLTLEFDCPPGTNLLIKPSPMFPALAKGPFVLRVFNIEGYMQRNLPPAIHRTYTPNPDVLQQWNEALDAEELAAAQELEAAHDLEAVQVNQVAAGPPPRSSCVSAHKSRWRVPPQTEDP